MIFIRVTLEFFLKTHWCRQLKIVNCLFSIIQVIWVDIFEVSNTFNISWVVKNKRNEWSAISDYCWLYVISSAVSISKNGIWQWNCAKLFGYEPWLVSGFQNFVKIFAYCH